MMAREFHGLYEKTKVKLSKQSSFFDWRLTKNAQTLVRKYALSVLFVAGAAGLRVLLEETLGARYSFLLFYTPVMLAALVGGLGAGLLATALSAFVVDYFFLDPPLSLSHPDLRYTLAMAIFCLNGVFMTVIAERMRRARTAQAQLKGAETLRLAIDSTDLNVFDVPLSSAKPLIRRWNWSYKEKHNFGLPAGSTAAPEMFFSAVHPDDRQRVEKLLQDALKPGTGGNYRTEYRTIGIQDGKERWLAAWGRVFFDDHHRPVRLVGATQDITERKRMEEALRKVRDELEKRVEERTVELRRQAHLLDLSQDAIFVRELDGTITFWNAGAEALYGWSREEAIGRVSREMLQTVIPGSPGEIMDKVLKTGRWEGELQQRTKDGRKLVVWIRLTLQSDETDHPIAIMATHTDITKQRYLEQQLRQAQKMEAIGTLAGGVAHDFNNVLAVIFGNAELALDEITEDGPRHRVEQILKATMRARDVVKELLTFARKSEKERKEVRLSPLIDETVKFLRATLPVTIKIELNISATSDVIQADPVQIQQVVMNLATNAAHAMRQDGGRLRFSLLNMSIAANDLLSHPDMASGPYVVLSVGDTGQGMDESVMARIFEPFFTTKELGQGTGLGLSVVYGIVKSHKGEISVSSRPGHGTIFRVYLPAVKTTSAEEPETTDWSILPRGKERLLFVDDEEAIMEIGRAVLTRLGYEVVARRSGREAFAAFVDNPDMFDAVITDQTMPDMTGLNLAAKLLHIKPQLPVILCTGYSESVSRESAHQVGIREFLMKPLSKREMAEAVRRVLEANKQPN